MLISITAVLNYGQTYFNSLVGAGGVYYGLRIQALSVLSYMVLVYLVIETGIGGLALAWSTEIVYWALLWWLSARGLSERRWRGDVE